MSMSVDGFVAGPNGETDWMFPSMSDAGRAWVIELFESVGLQAIGRKVYEDWAGFWPTSPLPMARFLNTIPKAVFSRSGELSALNFDKIKSGLGSCEDEAIKDSWLNSMVTGKDLVADMHCLKRKRQADFGSRRKFVRV